MRKLLTILGSTLLLTVSGVWAVSAHDNKTATPINPPKYGVPQEVPVATQTLVTDTPSDSPPSDPVPVEQPASYTLLDLTVNHIGFTDSASFSPPTDPSFNWVVNVSFTPIEGQGTQALLFVVNADTDCSQTPPDRFGCGIMNLADVETHGQTTTFSFPEQGMANRVYLKLAAGIWHVTVTAYDKPLYTVIRAETMADYYGN